jgi:single-strand DNA-binding protein
MIILTATGRVGKDAELRSTNSGDKILSFSVGSDIGYGQNKSTVWLDCSIWGARGEKLVQFLTKGTSVTVIGEFGQRTYQNKSGETVTAITVKVMEVALQGGGQQQERQSYQAPARSQGGYGGGRAPKPGMQDLDDEIPFSPCVQ